MNTIGRFYIVIAIFSIMFATYIFDIKGYFDSKTLPEVIGGMAGMSLALIVYPAIICSLVAWPFGKKKTEARIDRHIKVFTVLWIFLMSAQWMTRNLH